MQQDGLHFIESGFYFVPRHSESLSRYRSYSQYHWDFLGWKILKDWQQETEQELVQASRAQWLYGYEIQHFLCKAFSEEWQCQAATKPSLLSSQNGRQTWCRGHSVQSFSPRRQDSLSRVSEKTDPRLSCVNHNSSLIPSYKTWTHNSQTDLGPRLRPPVGNLFPSVIRIGAVIVTGLCLTKWNHTFIYFLRTWFNVTFDTFLLSWAGMNIEHKLWMMDFTYFKLWVLKILGEQKFMI